MDERSQEAGPTQLSGSTDQEGDVSTSPAAPHLVTAGLTDPGKIRPLNEDSWQVAGKASTAHLWEQRGRLLVVADGMGGHAAGEVASGLAVETLYQHYYDEDGVPLPPAIRLERAVIEANLSVYEQAVSVDAQSGMGTTLVAAVVHEGRVLIANVGDSRAYLIRDGHAIQITEDHSWVAEQVKLGAISEEEAQTHAYRNLVTRCLGHRPGMQVDIFEHRLRVGDTLLLCSDGLSNVVSDEQLAAVLTEQEPEQAVQTLVEMANQNGGPDNITAVAANVLDLPAWLVEAGIDTERPERLATKTTQPIRLDRETMEAAPSELLSLEGNSEVVDDGLERATTFIDQESQEAGIRRWIRAVRGTGLGLLRHVSRPAWTRISPRRRATLLLAAIVLLTVLAIATLIALRAEKITRWLAWPTPTSHLLPTSDAVWPAPGSLLVHSLRVQVRLYAASP